MSESDDGDLGQDDPNDGAASALEPLLARRLTSRQRLLRLAVIAGLPLLTLIVILGANESFRQRIHGLVVGPTATLGPASNRIYLDIEVPWLRVMLDGHTVTPPILYQQPPITLTPGTHTLSWQADPFSTHICTISRPANGGDSCNAYVIGVYYSPSLPPARVLHLGEALSTVEPAYRAALTLAIQSALTASGGSDTVQPGEQYFVDGQGPATATQPLTATLTLTATLSATSPLPDNCRPATSGAAFPACAVDTASCADLCALPYANRVNVPAMAATDWLAVVPYTHSYTYTAPDGRVVADDQPLEYGGRGVGAQLAVF
ncbi:MAG: hypothetical protein ACRDHE_01525, partial [Ktedonobacterales bacterium]